MLLGVFPIRLWLLERKPSCLKVSWTIYESGPDFTHCFFYISFISRDIWVKPMICTQSMVATDVFSFKFTRIHLTYWIASFLLHSHDLTGLCIHTIRFWYKVQVILSWNDVFFCLFEFSLISSSLCLGFIPASRIPPTSLTMNGVSPKMELKFACNCCAILFVNFQTCKAH